MKFTSRTVQPAQIALSPLLLQIRGNRDSRSCVFLLRGSRHAVRRSVWDTNTTATSAAPGVGHGTMLHRRPARQPISQARSHSKQHPGRSSGTGTGSPDGLSRTERRSQARSTASLVLPQKLKQYISLRHRVGPDQPKASSPVHRQSIGLSTPWRGG